MTGPEEEELADLRQLQRRLHAQAHASTQVLQVFLGQLDLAVQALDAAVRHGRIALDDFYEQYPELK